MTVPYYKGRATDTKTDALHAFLNTLVDSVNGGVGVGNNPTDAINFEAEYNAVRSTTTGDEAANAAAFASLVTDLRNFSTRGGIRKIWFGRSNGEAYWLNTTVELTDLEDVIFVFDSGPEFSGSPGASKGVYFMWSGAAATYMFKLIASATTIQRGLHWQGSWTFATNTDGAGYGLLVDGVNNWGGPSSVMSLTTQGGTKYLERGLVLDRAITGDNAHGHIGAFYSGGAGYAIYGTQGDVSVEKGNISTASGQTGVFTGPSCAEVKLGMGLKIDGGGTYGVRCQGSFMDIYCQFEGFNSATMVLIDAQGTGDSGKYNKLGMRCVGSDGTARAWAVSGASAAGNILDGVTYSNVANQAKSQDATIWPDGTMPACFDSGFDAYYRLISQAQYVTVP